MQFNLKKALSIVAIQCICGFISIQAFGQENEPAKTSKTPHYDVIEDVAEFPGGSFAFRKYLIENMRYPQDALDRGITGKCYVSFVVDTNGICTNFKIIKGIPDCPSCDQEAFRLVRQMPKWKPGLRNGKPIETLYRVPIVFKAY
ncbi:energy transducer TonB [Fluviicola sp.]|uniref:energy transducer TonB n=1 Tax=Fluviicola sp. TaxID=1917219 RepID=UPI0026372046|nr:energy transducer TonB [Fluviicola sp.]